jgi:hypothetical protein
MKPMEPIELNVPEVDANGGLEGNEMPVISIPTIPIVIKIVSYNNKHIPSDIESR